MIGRTLSHFRIIARLGEGGMGVVYRAEDERLRRLVALKVLPPDLVGSEERRLRFLREARAAAAVSHPNIAAVYDVGEDGGIVFIAMELVEGQTLRARLSGRPLPMKDALRIAIQVAEGLTKAHAARVIHRDLKPENIAVGADGQVKILDFGLAKLLPEEARTDDPAVSRLETISGELTRAGKILGTAAYMSPEQARGEPLDTRSDLFSFGTVLYEMATGRAPFQGRTSTDILSAIIRDRPRPATELNPEVPAELQRIIDGCLEKEPEDRYQHADQLAVDLRRLKRSSGSDAQVIPREDAVPGADGPGGWRALLTGSRARLALAAAVAVVLAAGGAVVWRLNRASPVFKSGDAVIVGDFENATGRPEFDTAVHDAFEHLLAQSRFLRVIRGDRLKSLLESQVGGRVSALDRDTALRLCRDGGCAGFVLGRIEPQGSGYRIQVKVQRLTRDTPVISRAAEAASDQEVLLALYQVSLDVRRALGESPRAIASTSTPTTRSLSAYQVYALAEALKIGGLSWMWFDEEVALYKRALEIDPVFVDAHADLAVTLQNIGNWREARKYAAEAHRLSAGLPERLRLLREILYLDTLYDYDMEIERLKGYRRLYPYDEDAAIWLGWNYVEVFQDPGEAEEPLRAAYEARPGERGIELLSYSLMSQGKVDEIERLGADFKNRTGSKQLPVITLLHLARLRGDLKGTLNLLDRIEREGGWPRYRTAQERTSTLLDVGRLRHAYTSAAVAGEELIRTRRFGLDLQSIRLLQSWLAMRRGHPAATPSREMLTPFENDLIVLETLIVHSVESGQAEPLARVTAIHEEAERGSKSRYVREQIAFARGTLALIRGQPARAREILEPLTRSSTIQSRHHVLGRAYEALGLWAAAASAYEAVVGNPHHRALYNPALWVLDQYRLGQIYERLADGPRARHWYGRFLDDWKDADPDIPELTTARQRLEALGGPLPAAD